MDYSEKINNAIEYIEANIKGEIDLNQAARKACCSVYHFERIFSFIADVTISEYVRRRRLTLAAFDLQNGAKVIDAALRYGYGSPESFSRAFKKLHGIMPAAVKSTGAHLKAYPQLSFNFSARGDTEIDYCITNKQAHNICGIKTDIPAANPKTNLLITEFWEDNIKSGIIGQFHRDIGLAYNISLNAALYDFSQSMFSYMICYEIPGDFNAPVKYPKLSVPAMTWAVFSTVKHNENETSETIRSMRKRIFLEWFPTSGYIHASGPEIEIFKNDREKYYSEIWIPIKKQIFI